MIAKMSVPTKRIKIPECLSKKDLSANQVRLLELMQSLNFGWIEHLRIANGDPVFDPPPKAAREMKFGGDNGARPESSLDDFILKSQVLELLRAISDLREGRIERIEVRHGLPFRMVVEESCRT